MTRWIENKRWAWGESSSHSMIPAQTPKSSNCLLKSWSSNYWCHFTMTKKYISITCRDSAFSASILGCDFFHRLIHRFFLKHLSESSCLWHNQHLAKDKVSHKLMILGWKSFGNLREEAKCLRNICHQAIWLEHVCSRLKCIIYYFKQVLEGLGIHV